MRRYVVAISQPTYLPWLGYFEQISQVDCFVFLDNVQFERRSWQSRNRIKNSSGQEQWLTVPVQKHAQTDLINQIKIAYDDPNWHEKHLRSIEHALAKTPHLADIVALLTPIYQKRYTYLADLTIDIIQQVSARLGLKTTFLRASQLTNDGKKDQRLLAILIKLGATHYLANAGSYGYLSSCHEAFHQQHIDIRYQQWKSPYYPQKHGAFIENLAWVDAIAYLGFDAKRLLQSECDGNGSVDTPTNSIPIKRFIFRVDASQLIGTGHVMRCLTLAQALKQQGAQCEFICRAHEGHLIARIEQQGFHCWVLSKLPSTDSSILTGYDAWLGCSWQQDAQDCMTLLADQRFHWLVVDHYALDQRWETQVSVLYHRLLVIDDLANRPHQADCLLDQTLARTVQDYQALVNANCVYLLGCHYSLLRAEFALAHTKAQQRALDFQSVKHILITMGGVDAHNMTGKVLDQLARSTLAADTQITVVMGSQAPHRMLVKTQLDQLPYLTTLLIDVVDMPSLMLQADLAIGAAGTTTWERLCVGLPSLVLCLADNQQSIIEAVSKMGAAWYLRQLDILPDMLHVLCHLPEQLMVMRQNALALVDGLGTQRVVNYLMGRTLCLKPAQKQDAELLYAWRNHPNIRAYSSHSDHITWETHLEWLNRSLANPNRIIWIAWQADKPIGVIRFDRDSPQASEAEVSLYVSPHLLRQGLGKQLLAAGEAQLQHHWPAQHTIRALVLQDNQISKQLFTSAGYQLEKQVFIKQRADYAIPTD